MVAIMAGRHKVIERQSQKGIAALVKKVVIFRSGMKRSITSLTDSKRVLSVAVRACADIELCKVFIGHLM